MSTLTYCLSSHKLWQNVKLSHGWLTERLYCKYIHIGRLMHSIRSENLLHFVPPHSGTPSLLRGTWIQKF